MKNKALLLAALVAIAAIPMHAADKLETCRAKLVKAQKLGVLRDLKWKGTSEPHVVIGPTFLDMAFDGKEGFAETVNCFLVAGAPKKFVNFDVVEWRNGATIGRFSYGRLKMYAKPS